MSDEAPNTPVEAEPTPAAPAATVATAPVAEPAKPEPDWKAAYVGLQTNLNKSHARTESLQAQNAQLASAVGGLKEDIDVLLKQTVGEEEFGKRVVNRVQAQERQAALNAAQAGATFIEAQTGLFLDTLKAAGVDPSDPGIDWARDAGNVQEWRQRVGPSIVARIQKAYEDRIKSHEASLAAKTAKEIKAEAEALTEQQLKANGVDRIDTAKGSARATFADRVRDPEYRNSPQFLKDLSDAKGGRLRT